MTHHVRRRQANTTATALPTTLVSTVATTVLLSLTLLVAAVAAAACPGGKTNKCCIPTDRRCPDKGGACGNVASCTGTVVSNLCPGEASNKCCVPSAGGGGSSGSDWLARLPVPAGINPRWSAARQSTMKSLLAGVPCGRAKDCVGVSPTYAKRALFVTASVGPFRVTGLSPAVASLRRVLAAVGAAEPGLAAVLGTVGMGCCRLVRGSTRSYSNHSWGTAIDIQVAGRTDAMGDDAVYAGLAALYPHFEAEGWYWGAGFRREDAMHFEVSDERVREWAAAGLLDM
eukprot:contig_12606_g3017